MIRRLFLPLAALLFVAACSGATAADDGVASIDDPGGGSGGAPSPSAAVDREAAMLAFARCMREHGVDVPDPAPAAGSGPTGAIRIGGDDGIDPKAFEAANEACREHIEGLMPDGGPNGMSPEDQDRMIEFARCMRDHGIDMPDPQFSDGGAVTIGGPDGAIDFESPEFKAAEEACRDLLPGLGGGPGVEPGGGAVGGSSETQP